MKHLFKNFLLISLSACISNTHGNSIIIPRSQSVNAARELVGWQQFINRADEDCNTYGAFAFTAEYQQSFRNNNLLQCLFDGDIITTTGANDFICDKNCNNNYNNIGALKIQGRCVNNRDPNAWLADYFGLDPIFNSTVFFMPKIQNGIFDFNFYVGLDKWMPGGYFRIHAPIVWTKWQLNAYEIIHNATIPFGASGFGAGYMGPTEISILGTSFLNTMDGTFSFGDLHEPLAFGKFCNSPNAIGCGNNGGTLVRLSDIEMALGYNFLLCEDYHFGLNLRGSAPAGNKPSGQCVFEPIVGNGKFWTLGVGLSAHAVLWRDCECPDRTLSFYIDANVNHLFNSCQRRSFDLIGKPNSRYALIEEFALPTGTTVTNNAGTGFQANLFVNPIAATAAGSTIPDAQYTGNLFYLINKSTLDAKVSFAGQADIALKLSYTTTNWDLDLGYEFWGRSKEKICLCKGAFPEATYALKGDARVYGFTAATSATLGANAGNPVRLSATENLATIHSGTNFLITGGPCSIAAPGLNPNVDNPQFAMFGLNGNPPVAATDRLVRLPGLSTAANQIKTSAHPAFIRASDLDVEGSDSVTTNKIFGNISYTWKCNCWSPFIGIGGEVEFGSDTNGSCSSAACSTSSACSNACAISQWGVWIKGGLAFN
jgi:hypothetical protein